MSHSEIIKKKRTRSDVTIIRVDNYSNIILIDYLNARVTNKGVTKNIYSIPTSRSIQHYFGKIVIIKMSLFFLFKLQQLGNDIFKYEILKTYQVNQYVAADGSMPFKEAPNEQITICSWKQVT